TNAYRAVATQLGLIEWTPVVWLGRLFALDNDYGEHWLDNWDARDALEAKAAALGIDAHDLMIIHPGRLQDGKDGPCHPPELRKAFWTDVLQSLELSYPLLFEAARHYNRRLQEIFLEDALPDLEARIAALQTQGSDADPA